MNDNVALLRALSEAAVPFTVVGGAAAVLHGSATVTYDLDVLMPFNEDACGRLIRAVTAFHPRLSHTPDKRPLTYSAAELAAFSNLYLVTDLGRLDVLGSLPPLADAAAVHRNAIAFDVGGMKIRVISLEDLIAVKAAMSRPKDKIVEQELRAIRALQQGRR